MLRQFFARHVLELVVFLNNSCGINYSCFNFAETN